MIKFLMVKDSGMLLVNNVEQLKKVMVFNPQKSYYKFVCMVRAKDYKNGEQPVLQNKEKQEILVKQWLVDSEQELNKVLPDMLKLIELLKCRLYMATDRKSTVKTMVQARNQLQDYLDNCLCNENPQLSVKAFNKVMKSATSKAESSDRECRRWMFDIDTKNKHILKFVQEKICGEYYLATFETKNGYHVIADKKFNANIDFYDDFEYYFDYLKDTYKNVSYNILTEYQSCVEIKDNALVLVAMGN